MQKTILTTPMLKLFYLWYRKERKPKKVLCYTTGKMNEEEFNKLTEMVNQFKK